MLTGDGYYERWETSMGVDDCPKTKMSTIIDGCGKTKISAGVKDRVPLNFLLIKHEPMATHLSVVRSCLQVKKQLKVAS